MCYSLWYNAPTMLPATGRSGYSCAQITLGFLQTQRLTNGGEWKVADTTMVFFFLTRPNMLTRQV